jgi:hypothetical protein
VIDDVVRAFLHDATGLVARPRRSLRYFTLRNTQSPERAAVAQPAMRTALVLSGGGRNKLISERSGPGVEAHRASGCASSVRTACRSTSCADAAIARSPRCQQTTGQRLGRAHGLPAALARWFLRQHCCLSGQTSQVELARTIRSVLPSCTVPRVSSRFRPGAVVDVAGRVISEVAASLPTSSAPATHQNHCHFRSAKIAR